MKHANILPSNQDFQELELSQAYWYYYNIVKDNIEMKKALDYDPNKKVIGFDDEEEFMQRVKENLFGGKVN